MKDNDYWHKQATRSERAEGDLRRQLDAAWNHINQLGELLREQGLDAGSLTGHIDHLAAISESHCIESRVANECRMTMVSLLHVADDAVDKRGADPGVTLAELSKRLLALNEKWKANDSLKDARKIVAERRSQINQLLGQQSLFEAS